MNKQNLDQLATEAEKRAAGRERRKRRRMKVSGAGVKRLQKIILSSSEKIDMTK
ncbi:MAG: hypothetical protein PHS62_02435 [Patescibacteria group bacterium]|nr:hypothetical protein [Patescibacteria group bacterium]